MSGYTPKLEANPIQATRQDQLKIMKEELKKFIEFKIQKAGELQPHMNFDQEDFSKKNIENLLSVSNFNQKFRSEVAQDSDHPEIQKTFSKLENEQLVNLCDILLDIKKEENVLKKIE